MPPPNEEAYRFEVGGGHWIFGGDPCVIRMIREMCAVKSYIRRSSVFLHEDGVYVPYPLQNNLRYLNSDVRRRAIREMENRGGSFRTMKEWLYATFGGTLCDLFFHPFHTLYTAGLDEQVAPQDSYKTPVNLDLIRRGAEEDTAAVGYNVTYLYPEGGLDYLVRSFADQCDVRYGKCVCRIDVNKKSVFFEDGTSLVYDVLASTLPLNKCLQLVGHDLDEGHDPYTSVLVLNIGAVRGPKCPTDHWIYNARTESKFHRVGFYSNVDNSFLPKRSRKKGDRVSIYVERSFPGGQKLSREEIDRHAAAVVSELKEWQFIGTAEVVDPTWIDVAYTWKLPGSTWREKAIKQLEEFGIYQIGRYGRWSFQGIADSIRDGLYAGSSMMRQDRKRRRRRAGDVAIEAGSHKTQLRPKGTP